MSDDDQTQQFSLEPEPEPDPQPVQDEPDNRPKRIVFILAGIVAALVLLIAYLLASRGDDTNTVSDDTPLPTTPTTTAESTTPPTTEPTTTVAPPATTGPTIITFAASTSVRCNTQAPNPSPQYVTFRWSTKSADQVYFGVSTDDASTGALFDNLPSSGNQSDFPAGYSPFAYNCPSPKQTYTLTAVDDSGKKVSKKVAVVNLGDTQ